MTQTVSVLPEMVEPSEVNFFYERSEKRVRGEVSPDEQGLQISVVIQDWLIISDLVTYLVIFS